MTPRGRRQLEHGTATTGPIIVELGERSAWVYGPPHIVKAACDGVDAPRMRCRHTGAITIPRAKADDLMVFIEAIQHRRIVLRMVTR